MTSNCVLRIYCVMNCNAATGYYAIVISAVVVKKQVKFRDLITWCNISYQPICNERDTWKFGVTTNVKAPVISEVSRRDCNFVCFISFLSAGVILHGNPKTTPRL